MQHRLCVHETAPPRPRPARAHVRAHPAPMSATTQGGGDPSDADQEGQDNRGQDKDPRGRGPWRRCGHDGDGHDGGNRDGHDGSGHGGGELEDVVAATTAVATLEATENSHPRAQGTGAWVDG